MFVLLVDGSDRLDLCLERLEDLLVLHAQVDVEARHRVELGQQLQRLRNLHQHIICLLPTCTYVWRKQLRAKCVIEICRFDIEY